MKYGPLIIDWWMRVRRLRRDVNKLVTIHIQDRLEWGWRFAAIYTGVNCAIILLMLGFVWISDSHLIARLIASGIIAILALYNLIKLISQTIPEIIDTVRFYQSNKSYVLRHTIALSLVDLLITGQSVVLLFILGLLLGLRSTLFGNISLLSPWVELYRSIM